MVGSYGWDTHLAGRDVCPLNNRTPEERTHAVDSWASHLGWMGRTTAQRSETPTIQSDTQRMDTCRTRLGQPLHTAFNIRGLHFSRPASSAALQCLPAASATFTSVKLTPYSGDFARQSLSRSVSHKESWTAMKTLTYATFTLRA